MEPWEDQARTYMAPSVKIIASSKAPVFISLQSALLQWPDRTVGIRYITGHRIVGNIEESFIFRKLPPEQVRPDTSAELLAASKPNMKDMFRRVRMSSDAIERVRTFSDLFDFPHVAKSTA